MIDKLQQVQLKKLLSEAVLLLCRNGLPIDSPFSIEAMIGITLSEDEVFLVSFRETVEPERSCEPLQRGHPGRYSRSCRETWKDTIGNWTGNSTDGCESFQRRVEDSEDCGDREREKGFGYDAGFRSYARDIVVKSEVVNDYEDGVSSDFPVRDDELKVESCKNEDFERDVKSESNGFESFERPACDTSSSSLLAVETKSTPYWVPLNRKGRTRSQATQRSAGSRYGASAEQKRTGPVYLESAESLTSVEKILSAIYPPTTDNQSLRCHVCGAELKGRRTLMEHIRGTHLAIHSYHCPDCGLGFKWRSSLKHHRARNCTLPSVLAASYGCRATVGAEDPPYHGWTAVGKL